MFRNMALLSIVVFLVLAVNVNAFTYQVQYWDNSNDGTSIQTDPVSFRAFNGNSAVIRQSLFFKVNTSTTSNYTANWLSPYGSTIGTYTGTLAYNNSCLNLGTATKSLLVSYGEGRNTITHDAASNPIYTKNDYTVTTTNRYLNISTYGDDSEGYLNNFYFISGTYAGAIPSSANIITNLNNANYGQCKTLLVDRNESTITPKTGNMREFAYLIFNSTAGNVSWRVRSIDLGSARATVYRLSDSVIVDTQTSAGVLNWNDNAQLAPNTIYVLGLGGEHGSVSTIDAPYLEVLVDTAVPDYSDCTDWTDCEGGYETRTCNDVNGYQPQSIEQRTCEPTVLENATLGFEEFTRESDIWKCSPTWFLGCGYQLNQTYRDSPLNWSIGENSYAKRDFLMMTTDWATEGSRSLKMWYIPPKQGEVVINSTGYPVSCGNVTGGTVPYVTQNISNDTFEVSFNVTFPAENMLLRYDVKGCEEQVLQHTDLYNTLLIPVLLCSERCYAGSCNGTPNSRYAVNLIDTTTGNSVFGYAKFREASINRADEEIIDLSNLGITAGKTYTLLFSVYPENLDDTRGNCFYVDNVRYERIAEPFVTTFLGGSCQTQCIGDDLYEATLLQNGECSVRKITAGCLGDEISDALNNGESICSDSNTLLRLNPITKIPEEIDCPYGCSNGQCNTEEQTDPTTSSDTLGSDMLGFLTEPFTWAIAITLLSIILSAIFMGMFNVKSGIAQISLGVGLVVNIFFIVAEWTPFWWGLMISAGMIILISGKVVDLSGVGGG